MARKQKMIPARRSKVAIIGFTQHSNAAPWADDSWELWGLNDLHPTFEAYQPGVFTSGRVRWFQLHRDAHGNYPGARDPTHTEWLKSQTCPIYLWEPKPEVPASLAYPMTEVLKAFPRGYFNNSISWMIALAIYEGFKTIGIYGVDMALDGVHGQSEYSWQRPSVEFFCGIAEGRGIELLIPNESEILKCGYLYGWDNVNPVRAKLTARLGQLEAQENDYVNQYEAIKRALHEVRGAKNDCQWMLRNYFPGDGQFQDVPRNDRAIVRSDLLTAPSDGRPIVTKTLTEMMKGAPNA